MAYTEGSEKLRRDMLLQLASNHMNYIGHYIELYTWILE